jgi:hypothetical protein
MIPEKVSRVLGAHGLAAIEFEPASAATSQPAAGAAASSVPMTFAQLVAITGGAVGRFTVMETADHPTDGA